VVATRVPLDPIGPDRRRARAFDLYIELRAASWRHPAARRHQLLRPIGERKQLNLRGPRRARRLRTTQQHPRRTEIIKPAPRVERGGSAGPLVGHDPANRQKGRCAVIPRDLPGKRHIVTARLNIPDNPPDPLKRATQDRPFGRRQSSWPVADHTGPGHVTASSRHKDNGHKNQSQKPSHASKNVLHRQ
jgi:hypothetical protein